MSFGARLAELGYSPSAPFQSPTGRPYPFSWVRVRGDRAYVSGHLPLNPDGTLAEPRGKVGAELSVDQGKEAARRMAVAMLGSLQRELGSLDRVRAWLRVLGMVNAASGFHQMAAVINGFSEVLLEVFGPEAGAHSRSAVGMAELPFNVPVEIEAGVEVEIGP